MAGYAFVNPPYQLNCPDAFRRSNFGCVNISDLKGESPTPVGPLAGTPWAGNCYLFDFHWDSSQRGPTLVLAAWEVPMDHAVPILVIAFVVATVVVFYVTGRAWQRRHTYNEDFWHRGGW